MWLTPLLLILFGLVEVIANAFFLCIFFGIKIYLMPKSSMMTCQLSQTMELGFLKFYYPLF